MVEQTSLQAYFDIKQELGDRQKAVYDILKQIGPANNLMIARKLELPINSITPRVLELRQKGMIRIAFKCVCPFTKRITMFWEVVK